MLWMFKLDYPGLTVLSIARRDSFSVFCDCVVIICFFSFIVAFYSLFRYFCRYISEFCKMMNKDYESPLIEILEVEVEKGYMGSIPSYDEEDFNWN